MQSLCLPVGENRRSLRPRKLTVRYLVWCHELSKAFRLAEFLIFSGQNIFRATSHSIRILARGDAASILLIPDDHSMLSSKNHGVAHSILVELRSSDIL